MLLVMLKSIIYIICKKQANIVALSGICDMLSGYVIGAMLLVIYYWVKLYFTDICNLPTVP